MGGGGGEGEGAGDGENGAGTPEALECTVKPDGRSYTNFDGKKLEAERSDRLDILEFVPEDSVDLTYIEDTRYVGPAKGGDHAYKLLADSMARMKRSTAPSFSRMKRCPSAHF